MIHVLEGDVLGSVTVLIAFKDEDEAGEGVLEYGKGQTYHVEFAKFLLKFTLRLYRRCI